MTVFTTAFRDYALEGFELGVIDFLLKPFSYERFKLAEERVKEFLFLRSDNASLDEKEVHPEFIFVKSGVNRIRLALSDVTHIRGLKDYAIIHTTQRKVVIKGSVKSVHMLFPQGKFIRIHKSFIVSKDKVRRLEKNKIIIGENEIPIGRNYRAEVEEKIIRV
ncbi:LytTr DNA-binding domain protein [compost metagenome]